jgi:hypothetical protein
MIYGLGLKAKVKYIFFINETYFNNCKLWTIVDKFPASFNQKVNI